MSEEQQAAQSDPLNDFVNGANDQSTTQDTPEAQQSESATEENVTEPTDGFQKRVNKLTADKYEEKRKREAEAKRADGLQKRLDELEAKKTKLSEPTLEDFDFDEDAYSKASVSYQVQEQVKSELTNQKARQEQVNQQARMDQSSARFNERAAALGKDDFAAKAGAIPELPQGVASAIMDLENGAEMVYHLGTHLDQADALATMSPMAAMMELGKLSSKMSVKPQIKTSAAPDPITPVSSGSALNTEVGDEMSMSDWMSKFG